jgi:V8-like Glu-specific endopeptidase
MISRRRIQLPLLLLMAAALSCVSAEALRRDSHRRTETIDERLDENAPDHDDFARNKQTRIVNGEDVVDPTRYPWFVQLRTAPDANGVQRACGGSLIAPDIVLTAAHCACVFPVSTVCVTSFSPVLTRFGFSLSQRL